MSDWDDHLIDPETLGVTWDQGTGAICSALVRQVRHRWRLLQDGIHALEQAGVRQLGLGTPQSLSVVLFHNPARLASVIAAPSAQAWCPLCAANVPPQEQGIAVGDDLVALPNPAPIVRDHIVFAHRRHIPQALRSCLDTFALLLARSGDDTAFLYNGPTSGASSPYHLHLQAGRSSDLPLVHQEQDLEPMVSRAMERGRIEAIDAGGRRFIRFISEDSHGFAQCVEWILHLLDRRGEFPLNLIAWRRRGMMVGALFPRSGHRPQCYGLPEDQRIVISPGSVEMAGLVVLPRHQDWLSMDPDTMHGIYREVCLHDRTWHELCHRLAE